MNLGLRWSCAPPAANERITLQMEDHTMNDATRIAAVEADAAMLAAYRTWKSKQHRSRRHIRVYVKEHRAQIDAAIEARDLARQSEPPR
jgi:hypothetical protein